MNHTIPCALTIAGSDPCGGAGIQVDLKTFAATECWGMAIITALTAQNACQVSGVWVIEPEAVAQQIQTLLEDMTPGAVKTGMLATADIVHAVVETLPVHIPLVVDPVMISTSGHQLLNTSALMAIREELLPRTTLLTPNIPEAEVLAGIEISNEDDMVEAGKRILGLGVQAVVVKGGHGSGDESVDLVITREGVVRLNSPRLSYQVHGSGCCFSAAITGYLTQGYRMNEACMRGKELVSRAIQYSFPGKGGMRMINPGGIRSEKG